MAFIQLFLCLSDRTARNQFNQANNFPKKYLVDVQHNDCRLISAGSLGQSFLRGDGGLIFFLVRGSILAPHFDVHRRTLKIGTLPILSPIIFQTSFTTPQ
jgi:hypothetical protein